MGHIPNQILTVSHLQKSCTQRRLPVILSPTNIVLAWTDHINWFLGNSEPLDANKNNWPHLSESPTITSIPQNNPGCFKREEKSPLTSWSIVPTLVASLLLPMHAERAHYGVCRKKLFILYMHISHINSLVSIEAYVRRLKTFPRYYCFEHCDIEGIADI